jgi:hypothetical protein
VLGKGRLVIDDRKIKKPVARRTDPFSGSGPLTYRLTYAFQWGHETSAVLMPSHKMPAVQGSRGSDLSSKARRALSEGIRSMIADGELPPFPFKERRTGLNEGSYYLNVAIPAELAMRVRAAWVKYRADRVASVAEARHAS